MEFLSTFPLSHHQYAQLFAESGGVLNPESSVNSSAKDANIEIQKTNEIITKQKLKQR
jgi:hypothetical protein